MLATCALKASLVRGEVERPGGGLDGSVDGAGKAWGETL
jgi:hypothetical protein